MRSLVEIREHLSTLLVGAMFTSMDITPDERVLMGNIVRAKNFVDMLIKDLGTKLTFSCCPAWHALAATLAARARTPIPGVWLPVCQFVCAYYVLYFPFAYACFLI